MAAWSRPLTVVLLVTGVVFTPLLGSATVEPVISTALAHLSSQLLGAVVMASYLLPASQWFHNDSRREKRAQ
jgi:hypothetical protein